MSSVTKVDKQYHINITGTKETSTEEITNRNPYFQVPNSSMARSKEFETDKKCHHFSQLKHDHQFEINSHEMRLNGTNEVHQLKKIFIL